jgi:hypothetical protein
MPLLRLTLKLLAPYIAVGFFWCFLSNAWLAILAYHVQIVLWSWSSLPQARRTVRARDLFLAVPAILTGPLLYVLLPFITRVELSAWLSNHHLAGISLLVMIPYFGLVHPFLEQAHWGLLRERTPLAHPLFAGYHVMVLSSLLPVPWLVLCFAVLVTASCLWQRVFQRTGTLAVPVVSHMMADLGVVLAAWFRV